MSSIYSHFIHSGLSHCRTITIFVRSLFLPFSICSGPFSQYVALLRCMNSTTECHSSVDTALFIVNPQYYSSLKARPIITGPHPPSLPLEGSWVAIRILVVLVCLPSHIRLKFPSWNAEKASAWIAACYGLSIDTLQNYVSRMERRLVRHCVNCNRTIHFQTLLILVVVAFLQSPTYQVSPGVLPRLEQ